MIVKSDQDRVRALLTEAITVLCKKRLSFKSQLSVEGLIGITLDSDDIFLVSIKELVLNGSDETLVDPALIRAGASSPTMMGSTKARSGRQRKSTPRHVSVVSPPLNRHFLVEDEEEEEECVWQLQDGTDIDDLNPVSNVSHVADGQLTSNNNMSHDVLIKEEALENRIQEENGIDAPLNLSSSCSSYASRISMIPNMKPHRDITPQKRKRVDSADSQCSGTLSAKRLSSISTVNCASPAYCTTPTAELVVVKQEPYTESAPLNNNQYIDHSSTNSRIFIQPATEKGLERGFSNGVMKDTGNILACRANLIESAIWQRLAAPITPLQLSLPIVPSQANFVCPKCGRRMQHLGGWTRHVERCGTPRFCNVCGKQFKTSNSLRVHRFHYHRPPQSNAKVPAKGAAKTTYHRAAASTISSSQSQLLGCRLAPMPIIVKPEVVEPEHPLRGGDDNDVANGCHPGGNYQM